MRDAHVMNKKAFFITRLGQKESDERRRTDDVSELILEPVLTDFEIELERADKNPQPGSITDQVINSILEADVLLADVTGGNPNVFYELGIAHSFQRPVILLVGNVDELPFDTAHQWHLEIGDDGQVGVREAEVAQKKLKEVLTTVTKDGYEPPSPVADAKKAAQVKDLESDNPLAEQVSSMQDEVRRLTELSFSASEVAKAARALSLEAIARADGPPPRGRLHEPPAGAYDPNEEPF